jgi:hypothetical protein
MKKEKESAGSSRIRFLYSPNCPNRLPALELLRKVMAEERVAEDVETVEVADLAAAAREKFPGSPTIQIGGKDVVPGAERAAPGLG